MSRNWYTSTRLGSCMRRYRAREPLPLDLGPVSERPRSAQVYKALKSAIVSLELAPGAPISEHRICRHSGVSRTPVREAIIRLSQEGLIEVFPQQGSRVAPISLGRVMQGHFIRETLEMAVIRRAAIAWREPFRGHLATTTQRMKDAAAAGDHRTFHRLDERFHATFAACAGLEEVSRVIQESKIELDRVRQLANPVEGHMQKVLAEHANDRAGDGVGQCRRSRGGFAASSGYRSRHDHGADRASPRVLQPRARSGVQHLRRHGRAADAGHRRLTRPLSADRQAAPSALLTQSSLARGIRP